MYFTPASICLPALGLNGSPRHTIRTEDRLERGRVADVRSEAVIEDVIGADAIGELVLFGDVSPGEVVAQLHPVLTAIERDVETANPDVVLDIDAGLLEPDVAEGEWIAQFPASADIPGSNRSTCR